MRNEVDINNEILTWAIVRAGFDFDDFTRKEPNVIKWLEGEKKPTVNQLEKLSKKVFLPFGYFFLNEPPKEELPIPFFRTKQGKTKKVSINVYDTILILQKRQDWLKEYLQDNEVQNLPYVGKFKDSDDVLQIVNDIRETLGLSETWASEFRTWQDALNYINDQIEDAGIITTFNGIVGNNTRRKIPVEECRGFVLVDDVAPFMFINNADGKAAQMFTMAHELAHIWTGHSAGFDFRQLHPADDPIEKICDKVAAELLVPGKAFNIQWAKKPNIQTCARFFKVSEIVIARRALDTNKITKADFFAFYNEYSSREFHKKEGKTSGGDFYATTKKRLSITFAAHINNAVNSGQLLFRDAYKLTNLQGDTFQKFFTKHLQA